MKYNKSYLESIISIWGDKDKAVEIIELEDKLKETIIKENTIDEIVGYAMESLIKEATFKQPEIQLSEEDYIMLNKIFKVKTKIKGRGRKPKIKE